MPHLHKTMRRLTKNQKKAFVPPSMEPDFYQMPTLPTISPSMVNSNRNNLNHSQQQEPSPQTTIPSSAANAGMLGDIQSQISSILGNNSSGSNNKNALLAAALALSTANGHGNGLGNNNYNNNSINLGAGNVFDRPDSSTLPNVPSMGNNGSNDTFQNLSMPNILLLLQSLQSQRQQQEQQQEQLQQLRQIQSLISQNNSGLNSNFLLNQIMNNSQPSLQATNANTGNMFRNNSLDSAGPRIQSSGYPPSSLSSTSMLLQNQLLNNAISNRNGVVQSSNGGTQFGQSDARIQQDGGVLELLLQRLSSSVANPSQNMANTTTRSNYAYASSLSFSNNSSGSGGGADETSSSSNSSRAKGADEIDST